MRKTFLTMTMCFFFAGAFFGCSTKDNISKIPSSAIDMKFVNLSSAKNLSKALAEVGTFEGCVYFLKSDDFQLPVAPSDSSRLLNVNNFESLKKYIENTTDYTIEITKNRFLKDMKIVSVFGKEARKNSLQKVAYTHRDEQGMEDALLKLTNDSGFAVIVSHELNNGMTNKPFLDEFYGSRIKFDGDTAEDFLEYLKERFNVYVDVDHKKKIIYITKYKTNLFKITTQNGVIAPFSISKLSDELKGLLHIEKDGLFSVDAQGVIIMKSTRANMVAAQKIFNEYNKLHDYGLEPISSGDTDGLSTNLKYQASIKNILEEIQESINLLGSVEIEGFNKARVRDEFDIFKRKLESQLASIQAQSNLKEKK